MQNCEYKDTVFSVIANKNNKPKRNNGDCVIQNTNGYLEKIDVDYCNGTKTPRCLGGGGKRSDKKRRSQQKSRRTKRRGARKTRGRKQKK